MAWRATGLACLLAATACGGGAPEPSPAAPPTTTQVVVFDAVRDPFLGTLIPYAPGDLRLDTGAGGTACPPSAHVAPGGIAAFDPAAVGLGGVPIRLGDFLALAAGDPPPPGVDPAGLLEDDCDVSAAFPELAAWLATAVGEADAIAAELETCAAAAELRYCEIVRKVEAAETTGPVARRDDIEYFFGPGQLGRTLPDVSSGSCSRFLMELHGIAGHLDALRFDRARCEDVLVAMQSILDRTRAAHTPAEKSQRRIYADSLLHEARGLLDSGRLLAARVRQVQARFDPDDVKASCAGCTPVGVYRRPLPAGHVQAQWQGDALAAVVAALVDAAGNEQDAKESAWLDDLAERLREVPGERVRHVSFPGRSRIGTDYVALADPTLRVDEAEPHVVVLSVLPAGTNRPEPNFADLELLHEGLRLFVAALRREP